MKRLNDSDVMVDYAFMSKVEKFMRHGRTDVPEYMACMRRLAQLRVENTDAPKEKQRHLEGQILPGIAVYETLKTVMTPEETFRTVHGYVEAYALSAQKMLVGLLHLPGLYRLVPGISARMVHKIFGEAAGFAAKEYQTAGGVMRIDMVKCPYHETCVRYGCPELCACFCDSDDIAYDNMHPKLLWHRTKTLGRGEKKLKHGISLYTMAYNVPAEKRGCI